MDARDDIYEYSLDTHHSEEEGKKMRKKFMMVLALLSIVTIIEVAMGMMWSRDESMTAILKYTFITLTLVKAGYIVMIFMHLGDEKKSFQAVVLLPYFVLIGYLIFIGLTEGVYNGGVRPVLENYFGF
ncbi:MAG: cytochrome C oxidase subunit IV family protein [Flavobacteriales bacterium]|nr:cytochrome C oxidase subunit IV family protein [Flavobacteriales bacterium]